MLCRPEAVFGGFDAKLGFDGANEGLKSKVEELTGIKLPEVYSKGDTFSGVMYAKFESDRALEKAATRLRQERLTHAGAKVWVDIARPLPVRVQRGYLYDVKKLMINEEWGYAKKAVWVDEDAQSLRCGPKLYSELVVSTQLDADGKRLIPTVGPVWEAHLEGPAILARANERLSAAAGKGAGKGLSKGQPDSR